MVQKTKKQLAKRKFALPIGFVFTGLSALSLIIAATFIIILSYQGSRSAVLNVTERLLDEVSVNVAQQTQRYFDTSIRALNNLENGSYTLGLLRTEKDANIILNYLQKIAETHPEISAIYFGEQATGNFYMAKRMPNDSISHRTVTRTANTTITRWLHQTPKIYDQDFPPQEIVGIDEGYDPRKRSWYRAAIAKNDFIWTDPYVFASDESVGISVARKLYRTPNVRSDSDYLGVIAVDFGLETISSFLESIAIFDKENAYSEDVKSISKEYYLFILNQDNLILATSDPTLPTFQTTVESNGRLDYTLFSVDNYPNKLYRVAFQLFETTQANPVVQRSLYGIFSGLFSSGQGPIDSPEVINFNYNFVPYLATFEKFSPGADTPLYVGVILKEALVTDIVGALLNVILLSSIILVVILIFILLRILANVTKPIALLAEDMDKVRTFDFDSSSKIANKGNILREIQNMTDSYESMKNGLRSFKKFVPSEIVAGLIKRGQEANVSGEKLDITIFFSDIERFTVISEETPSEKLISQLRYYLNLLSNGIAENGGTLDKYIGDSIMAFWGAPVLDKDHPINACRAAIHCRDLSNKINERFKKANLFPMRTRIGIHSGTAIVGNIGSDVRLNYTAIGDNVNLSSRLEGLNKIYNTHIIISEDTYKHVRKLFLTRLLDKVTVYGKKNSVAAYELVDHIENVSAEDIEFYNLCKEGTSNYFLRDWNKAIKIFKTCLLLRNDDGPSQVLLERCKFYSKNAPGTEWDGIFTSLNK